MKSEKARLLELMLKEKGIELRRPTSIPRRRTSKPCPLSFAQQRLWFLDQMGSGLTVYNMPYPVRVQGKLNIKILEDTFTEIIRRHESLRTKFINLDGEPKQVISAPCQFRLPVVDLRGLADKRRESEMLSLVRQEANYPFDLANGPLLRVCLLHLDAEDYAVLFTMHHIICDGWSLTVMLNEINRVYEVFCSGIGSPLPELPVQYADFACWQRQWLQGVVLEEHLSFWRERLEGRPSILELPTDYPRPAIKTYHGASLGMSLPAALHNKLKQLCRDEEVTLFSCLLAAFHVVLYRYTGEEDIVIGTSVANRTSPETEKLIGFFVNLLALRTNVSGDPSCRELIHRVQEVVLDAYAHQQLPFEKLVQEIYQQRTLNHTPLFQVFFMFMSSMEESEGVAGLRMTSIPIGMSTAKFDVSFALSEGANGLFGSIEYDVDLFDGARIATMGEHFKRVLEQIAVKPGQAISDIHLLSDDETASLSPTDFPEADLTREDFESILLELADD